MIEARPLPPPPTGQGTPTSSRSNDLAVTDGNARWKGGYRREVFVVVESLVPVRVGHAGGFYGRKVVQAPVQQMRQVDPAKSIEYALNAPGEFLLPLAQHHLDLLALQVFL